MENPEVARIFDEIADLLEIQDANPFRVRAYRNAARTIRDLSEPVADIAQDSDRHLTDLPGIGKDLAEKITTIVKTGDLPLHQELLQQVPKEVTAIMRLPGLGPKRAAILHQELGVQSLEDLRQAAERGKIRELKGFGEKTERAILEGLQHAEQAGQRFYLAEAMVFAHSILRHLKGARTLGQIEVAGSLRRRKETVGDLDVLATSKDPAAVMDRFAQYEGIDRVLARGETKMTVRLKSGLQMDLRVVPEESFGAALQYFTGSKDHNIRIRRRGVDRGLKINEYGVFRGQKRVAGRTEEEVYAAVDLPWIPPELREDRGEIDRAEKNKLPKLVELDDLCGDLHMHTNATDGRASLEAMVEACKKRGHKYMAITDHSKRVTMARGMNAERLRQHWKAIDQLADKTKGIAILKGVEVDILEDGNLDLSDDVLKEADWVVASIHYGQNQPREKITRRILNAVENPYVHAIGHPTGRLIGKRKSYDVDLDTVLKAAADHGCMMELNAQPSRLDLDDVACVAAKDRGILIVISTDAHAVEELGLLEFGIYQARRAGLEAKDVANTRSLTQFRKLLRGR